MFEFTSIGPTKVDCDGCHDFVYVSYNKTDASQLDMEGNNNNRIVLIEKYAKIAQKIKDMEVYDDDIWVVSFPKSGTTWTMEMTWLLNNDLNYKMARDVELSHRVPMLEISGVLNLFPEGSADTVINMRRPRHIKTHLNVALLPDKLWTSKAKVFYVARNPKDCIVSYFHHSRHITGYHGSMDDFVETFLQDKVLYTPYFEHIQAFWNLRHKPNIMMFMYEDMQADLLSILRKISEFLGKNYTDKQLIELKEHLSADKMRKNPSCNNDVFLSEAQKRNNPVNDGTYTFIRKAKVGGYKEELSQHFIERIDKWTEESLKFTDFRFKC
ncbi:luciferin sulfotransferase-like [Culicoides brevitarsis]|uniref:luciferin sulfotransferase-like n=1 Tax=Culicoides brevitarsis TaxID=469753 RepID=UPI00307B9BFB